MRLGSKYIFTLSLILIVSFCIDFIMFKKNTRLSEWDKNLKKASLSPNSPPSLQTYYLIEKYCDSFKVPRYIVYNVAFKETRYRGPFDWDYNPYQSSGSGAVGAMQITLSTANNINSKDVKRKTLKNNLELNISTSVKLLKQLHKTYGDWASACGCYNTGKPIKNSYAIFCSTNKKYKKNWINF
jgi:hypothetical protein